MEFGNYKLLMKLTPGDNCHGCHLPSLGGSPANPRMVNGHPPTKGWSLQLALLDPVWYNLDLVAHVWTHLTMFGPISPHGHALTGLARFGLFDPIWPCLVLFGQFDPIWPCLVLFDPVWIYLPLFCPVWPPLLTQFNPFNQSNPILPLFTTIKSHLSLFNLVWLCLTLFGLFDPIWPCLVL